MAGTMGYKRMQRLTHDMENVFMEVREGRMKVNPNLVDIVFQCLDALEEYLSCIMETSDEGTNENEPIIARLKDVLVKEGNKTNEPAEAKQGQKETEKEKTENAGYHDVVLTDFERHAANEAVKMGMRYYGVTVKIEESCILKSARAFLVFKNIEPLGEVIRSEPSAQDIEDEKFENEFSLFIISRDSLEKILEAVGNISEIKSVEGEELPAPEYTEEAKTTEAVVENIEKPVQEVVKEEPVVAAKKPVAPTTGTGQTPAQHQQSSGKPVVNRSVRVDIEKLDVLMNLVSELITAKNGIVSVSESEKSETAQSIREQVEYLESITTNLHESVMKVRMVDRKSVV